MKLRDILFAFILIIAAFLSGLLVCLLCNCSLDVAGGSTETTNSKVIGILYFQDGTFAENVNVYMRPKTSLPDTTLLASTRKYIDTAYTTTDDSGRFEIDTIDTGIYIIEGNDGTTNFFLIDSVFINNSDSTVRVSDTLKPPGSITGTIYLSEGGDPRKVFILAFGLNRIILPDTGGNFVFDNLAEAFYDLRILPSIPDYGVLDTFNIRVTSSSITDMDTIELPYIGIPIPKNLTLTYDTLRQTVTLIWNAADTSLIKGYNVYRRHEDSNYVHINNTIVLDTFFYDSLNGGPPYDGTYFYYVTALDNNENEGLKSVIDSVLIKGNCQGWTPKASISPRMEHFALTIDNTLYCVGGVDATGALQSLMKYNPTNDTWENLEPIPEPSAGASACAAIGKIYYFGGKEDPTWFLSNYEYNSSINSWSLKQNDCLPGKEMSCCENDNIIYIIGGDRYNSGICDSVHIYNPGNDSWIVKSSMQTCRTKLTTCSVNGNIYSIGGYNGSIVLVVVEEYNPKTDQWTTKSPMPTARMALACCVLNGKIYVLGGFDGSNILSTVEMYDPATDRWTKKSPMPTAREGLSAAVVNGKILAIGGKNGSEIIGAIEEYTVYGDDR